MSEIDSPMISTRDAYFEFGESRRARSMPNADRCTS
jgi:hypothetical protein